MRIDSDHGSQEFSDPESDLARSRAEGQIWSFDYVYVPDQSNSIFKMTAGPCRSLKTRIWNHEKDGSGDPSVVVPGHATLGTPAPVTCPYPHAGSTRGYGHGGRMVLWAQKG